MGVAAGYKKGAQSSPVGLAGQVAVLQGVASDSFIHKICG